MNNKIVIFENWLDVLTSRQIKMVLHIKRNKDANGNFLLDIEKMIEIFGVSQSNIYRDLNKLVKEKIVIKTGMRNIYR